MFEQGATVSLAVWSVVESGMYLAAACLPLMRPVIGKVIIEKWKVIFHFHRSSRHSLSGNPMDHNSKNRAAPSNVTQLGLHAENPDDLENPSEPLRDLAGIMGKEGF
jgi:hypothetical protein